MDCAYKIIFIMYGSQEHSQQYMRDKLSYWIRRKIIILSKCIKDKTRKVCSRKWPFDSESYWLTQKKNKNKNEISGHRRNITPKMIKPNDFQTQQNQRREQARVNFPIEVTIVFRECEIHSFLSFVNIHLKLKNSFLETVLWFREHIAVSFCEVVCYFFSPTKHSALLFF